MFPSPRHHDPRRGSASALPRPRPVRPHRHASFEFKLSSQKTPGAARPCRTSRVHRRHALSFSSCSHTSAGRTIDVANFGTPDPKPSSPARGAHTKQLFSNGTFTGANTPGTALVIQFARRRRCPFPLSPSCSSLSPLWPLFPERVFQPHATYLSSARRPPGEHTHTPRTTRESTVTHTQR